MTTNSPSVTLILVDGLRPDGLAQASTPVLNQLIAEGAGTMSARTIMPSITLPCITSLFMGVRPERHGITSNTYSPPARAVPGLMDVVHAAGKRCASFYNWEQLRDLSQPGTLEAALYLHDCYTLEGDLALAEMASTWLRRNPVEFAFIYLGYTDTSGHDYGWMSPQYLRAIQNADNCIQQILSVRPQGGLVIIASDHGGHAQVHGTDIDEDMTIPIILNGPGIPAGTSLPENLSILDIAPTAVQGLGVPAPREWIGKPIPYV